MVDNRTVARAGNHQKEQQDNATDELSPNDTPREHVNKSPPIIINWDLLGDQTLTRD